MVVKEFLNLIRFYSSLNGTSFEFGTYVIRNLIQSPTILRKFWEFSSNIQKF